jgi:Ion channel
MFGQAVGMKPLSFRRLLIGILAAFLLTISIPVEVIGAPVRVAILAILLLLTLRTHRRSGALGRPALIVGAALTVATLAADAFGSDRTLTLVSQTATAALVVMSILVLARTLMNAGTTSGATVNGVLCIYLLIAMFFGSMDVLLATLTSHYVHGASTPVNTSQMLYFSVITLTTVGYGDISPANSLAEGVAAIEALIGQLYLVSVVAVVVSRYRPTRRPDPTPPEPEPSPDR